jgi:hypothetical protein
VREPKARKAGRLSLQRAQASQSRIVALSA